MMFRKIAATLVLAVAVAAPVLASAPASASTGSHHWNAYVWAKNHARGCWYVYGGTGPCGNGFDCSGVVYAAYGHTWFWLPRTTYGMFGSPHLRRETHAEAKMGDLVAFGSGHVEMYAGWHTTFGALQSGTRVGWHHWYPGSWWVPTGFYRVVW
jgi:cell wall-associated NlpC family hydrolase